jgi:hypothetical protein
MVDLTSMAGGLGTTWLTDLASRLARIREKRRKELASLQDVFAGDLVELVQRYIEPTVQLINPIEHRDELPPLSAEAAPLRRTINEFIELKIPEHDGRHVMFLLADAGMGKTSALVILKLLDLTAFWPKDYRFELAKLGPDTLHRVEKIENKGECILLLDALDEDPAAFGRFKARLEEILESTRNFRRIVITCRTQFLPPVDPSPFGDRRYFSFAGFLCNLRYLSPFSDEQVDEYLRKVFLTGFARILQGRSRVSRAKSILSSIGSLRMRPLILSYIEDLIELPNEMQSEVFLLYSGLVDRWLLRETRSLRKKYGDSAPTSIQLRICCEALASRLHTNRLGSAPSAFLSEVLSDKNLELFEVLDFGGRSLLNNDSSGAFRFAHRTIEEFLVVSYTVRDAISRPLSVGTLESRMPASDEMVNMLFSFARMVDNRTIAKLPGLSNVYFKSQQEKIEWLSALSSKFSIEQKSFPDRGGYLRPSLGISILNKHFDLQKIGTTLEGLDLSFASLKSANMAGYRLRYARLDFANLEGANLCGADLTNASLKKANLRNANLTDALLEGADLEGAILEGATCPAYH